MRYTMIENCMQRAKYYVLHYLFDDVLRNYFHSLADLVKIANFKYNIMVSPENIYYDLNGNLRTDWMLNSV
jgi:hypothetical protein